MSLAPDNGSEWTTLDRPGRLASAARAVRQMLPTLLLSIAALIGWELVIRLGHVSTYIVPAPSAIAVALVAHAQDLAVATVATAREVFVGFVLSLIVGIGLALLILVIAFFPITLNMLAGLHSVEAGLVALMKSVGASENEILFRVRVPHALPQLMAGVKIAITLCVIGAIVGEFAGASAGLGYVIQFASTQLETAVVFAALVVVSLLGSGFYYVSELLERLIVPWAPQFQDSGRS